MGNLPKQEGAYPKREIGIDTLQKITDRLQCLLTDYKRLQKVRHGLQSLLIDYKRLQKFGIVLKAYDLKCYHWCIIEFDIMPRLSFTSEEAVLSWHVTSHHTIDLVNLSPHYLPFVLNVTTSLRTN